jgi:hypothetical protein
MLSWARRILVTTWCHLPACLCGVVYGRLVVGGMLGANTVQLLERAPEEVAMSTLTRALVTVIGQHT